MNKKRTKQYVPNQFCSKFETFKSLSQKLSPLQKPSFKKLPLIERVAQISALLLELIDAVHTPCFLLPATLDFIEKTNECMGNETYSFSDFEFWLNQFSGLNKQENYLVRAKIVGKNIPREDYQHLFPLGLQTTCPGSHTVSAHGSPDLDTAIASFWGWVDAFGARISQSLHFWNMPPGGIYPSKKAAPLTDLLGGKLFEFLCQNQSTLSPTALDFATQSRLIKKNLNDSIISTEDHERHKYAIMVIDHQGHYVGDLRSEDHESIRQIIRLVTNLLKWFGNSLQTQLFDLFSKELVTKKQILKVIHHAFEQPLKNLINEKLLSHKLQKDFSMTLCKILGLKDEAHASVSTFAKTLKKLRINKINDLEKDLSTTFFKSTLFDKQGKLIGPRSQIFKVFHKISNAIHLATCELSAYMESLEMAIRIKRQVFGFPPRYVTPESTLDEVSDRMGTFNYLAIVQPNADGSLSPLGIIRAKDIQGKRLGTVSLRDFCNRREVQIDASLEIISVMDHHKADFKTTSPPFAIIGDVQSCNVLVAEQSFIINDLYSAGNLEKKELDKQVKRPFGDSITPSAARIKNRLLTRALAHKQSSTYFVHPQREYLEYLSFLHAIIDDTDLFSKATKRDVLCTAQLLNRIKSIASQEELETLSFDSIPHDTDFVKKAVLQIVQNPDMYSIYKTIFEKREIQIKEAIDQTALGKSQELFADTKEQNGCAHIGQTKIFSHSAPYLEKKYGLLLHQWWQQAKKSSEANPQVDLHMHMISTIPSAEEVYQAAPPNHKHQDALWIWIPQTAQAINRLSSFLNAFRNSPKVSSIQFQYQILGKGAEFYENIFKHHFKDIPQVDRIKTKKQAPIVILSFDAGTLNSRKTQITPFLPVIK